MITFGQMTRGILVDKKEIFEELRKAQEAVYNSFKNKDEYGASEHWVNNPLIKPISKMNIIEDLEESAFRAGFAVACNKISERINDEIKEQREERELTTEPDEKANISLFIAGLGMADRIIKWVQHEETK
jgi:hypothetical protein